MKTKELAQITNVSERYIRDITKKASEKKALFITLGGKKYSFESRKDGVGRPSYFYEEIKVEAVKIEIVSSNLNIS